MPARPVLYLIDGHAVAYRQFFAMPAAGFTTRSGEPTNATFGFTRILLDILEIHKPHYLAVSFDMGLSGRDEMFADYKGTRERMPDDLSVQMKRIHELVEAFNIPILELEGYEADDVMGTIAAQAEEQDIYVHIITGDRDILQLLSSHVQVQLPSRGNPDVVYDMEMFREAYDGLEPNQLVDLKALMGDSSDNIPGVKGIGQKGGTKLLLEYGTLDNIYTNIDNIKGANQKKLIADREMAYISQELATIQRDVPIQLNLEACVAQDYDGLEVDSLFDTLEFRSHRDRLRAMREEVDFGPEESDEITTIIVQNQAALDKLVKTLNKAEQIAWDVETTSTDQMAAELVGIAIAVDDKTGYYIPVGHQREQDGDQMTMFAQPVGEQLPLATVIEALRDPLTNPDIPKVAHNAAYDYVVMSRYGIDVTPIAFDTMIAEFVRDPISRFMGLKNLVRQRFGIEMTEITELIGSGKKQRTMAEVGIDEAAPYAAADAALTYKLVDVLQRDLEQIGLFDLFNTLEMPLVPVISAMEQVGVMLDVPFLKDMSERLSAQLGDIEQTIYDLGGGDEFNINSPRQLNDVLFENLKLPVDGLKKTTHGYSTNVATLEILRDKHPIIEHILQYRELSKLQNTYVDALPQLVNPRTGRVHTHYNQTGAATGRFSSSNPNLQNIPIRTELGREVRRAFIAPAGKYLLAVDYSQIELRVMAHISQDKTLLEAFRQGQDIHQATAAAVNRIPAEDVTYEQRNFAKRVNFGLMYGMGAFRLARESDLTLAEADAFIKTYFEQMPGVERYIEETKAKAIEQGYLTTLMGRRRDFPALKKNQGKGQSAQAELRAAINMPIQGTAADILKLAILNLYRELQTKGLPARMILQVHDELVLEVPEDALDVTKEIVVETMEAAYELSVPLKANASYGRNWLEMEDID